VLVPHPVLVGAVLPNRVQFGKPMVILSLIAKAEVHLKANVTVEAAPATGRPMAKAASEKAAAMVALEVVIALAPKLPLAAVSATVRVLRLAASAVWPTVAPDAHVRAQAVLAVRVAVAAVKTRFALVDVVKVVVPHPDVVGAALPVSVQPGKTSVSVSEAAMSLGGTKL